MGVWVLKSKFNLGLYGSMSMLYYRQCCFLCVFPEILDKWLAGNWSWANFAPKLGHFCPEVRLNSPLKLGSKCWKIHTGYRWCRLFVTVRLTSLMTRVLPSHSSSVPYPKSHFSYLVKNHGNHRGRPESSCTIILQNSESWGEKLSYRDLR